MNLGDSLAPIRATDARRFLNAKRGVYPMRVVFTGDDA
jgi:hypothetical protein